MNISKINPSTQLTKQDRKKLIQFLFDNLDEFKDPIDQIDECFKHADNHGGHLYIIKEDNQLIGACIILNTGMKGFLPPNFLVYIAIHKQHRGQGLGRQLLEFIQADIQEPICLHCEHNNPARHLYERVGFTNKYLEMRWGD